MSERVCKKCGSLRPLNEFRSDPRCKGGRRYECNECRNKKRNSRYDPAKQKLVNQRNSWYARAWRYGMSVEQLKEMLARQGGRCAICPKHLGEKPYVDHDHATGRVRGMLCNRCNTNIAVLDDSEWRTAAEDYLAGSLLCYDSSQV